MVTQLSEVTVPNAVSAPDARATSRRSVCSGYAEISWSLDAEQLREMSLVEVMDMCGLRGEAESDVGARVVVGLGGTNDEAISDAMRVMVNMSYDDMEIAGVESGRMGSQFYVSITFCEEV